MIVCAAPVRAPGLCASPMKTKTITIPVVCSPEQAALFTKTANNLGATPGDVLLALAHDRLNSNPCEGDNMAGLLWEYVVQRNLPTINEEWGGRNGFEVEQPQEATA